MDKQELPNLLPSLCEIVKGVGKPLCTTQTGQVMRKDGDWQDLVTDADIRVQKELCDKLGRLLPEAAFYAEEKENVAISGLTWLVDPIDGTTNFVTSGRDFAVSVALYDDETPLLAAVYDVMRDDLFCAACGHGAWRNGHQLSRLNARPLNDCLLDISLASLRTLMQRTGQPLYDMSRDVRAHRALGSAALSISHIACGELHIYLSSKLKPWDHAAASLILKETGGVVLPLFSDGHLFSGESTPIIACSSRDLAMELMDKWFKE